MRDPQPCVHCVIRANPPRYPGGAPLYMQYDGKCTDMSVGSSVLMPLSAPRGSSQLNALTSVVQRIVYRQKTDRKNPYTKERANKLLLHTLKGLDPRVGNVSNFDVLGAVYTWWDGNGNNTAASVYTSLTQMTNVLTHVAAACGGGAKGAHCADIATTTIADSLIKLGFNKTSAGGFSLLSTTDVGTVFSSVLGTTVGAQLGA